MSQSSEESKSQAQQASEHSASEEQLEASIINQLDDILPVGDVDEEVSEDGKVVRKRGVYILPNLFTTAALFSGFYSILSSVQGKFEAAAIAIFMAMIFDIADGRVARMMNAQTKFGAEYDSLSDMISFGMAPAIAMFTWALGDLGKVGFMAAFVYVAGAALRLARFNTMPPATDKRFFIGLASPASAAFLAALLWTATDLGYVGDALPMAASIAVAVATLCCGLLMVSNLKYTSFKGINLTGRVPFTVILIIIMAFALIGIDPPKALLILITLYNLSFIVLLGKPKPVA